MSDRLERRLSALRSEKRRGLAPFVTAGDGGMETTLAVLRALDAAGVACIELGVPFSDPIADGPVLQAASERALAAGTTFQAVLQVVAELRGGSAGAAPSEVPIALMGYANSFMTRTFEAACEQAAGAGVDAVLVADLPVEEGAPLASAAARAGICPIFFVAPTSGPERIARAVELSRGFVYAICRTGVTGASTEVDERMQRFLASVREQAAELPVAVGFGIREPAHVAAVTRHADLAIVGTALVERVHAAGSPARAAASARSLVEHLSKGLPE